MDDLISRQAAVIQLSHNKIGDDDCDAIIQRDIETIKQLPSAEPQIIRCKECRYYRQLGKSEWGNCLAQSRICKSIDFCSWGARMETEQILSEADNDTAYGGLMSAT